ncbi:iron-containing redox enzyme family protein [Hamadaea tsunoensis]|uniref:iron-containing redox enzyme family protein n=1 Tax=Hamadaea tsunoensis TaxID=53368 RepID=UPI0003FEEE55|nr:iron-containing redox enzyme family protein [Hamadaea tsunoensis]
MKLPEPRGEISDAVVDALRHEPGAPLPATFSGAADPCTDEDLQLTLMLAYEPHYRGFDGVDENWEWDLGLLRLRTSAERHLEEALRAATGPPAPVEPGEVARRLAELAAADDGPALGQHLQTGADLTQFREFVVHRSIYHLKEADPHSFALPRLSGRPKAALVEIQADEYGGGRTERMHAELFGQTMTALNLDPAYGAYLDFVPGVTLLAANLMSMFGLRRRLRGALCGQLAAFEMTSSLPNTHYGNGLRRLGGDADATRFYDVHVEADAVHEQIAAVDLCGSLATQEPGLCGDIMFGAAAGLYADRLAATHLMRCWTDGRTSLRRELDS